MREGCRVLGVGGNPEIVENRVGLDGYNYTLHPTPYTLISNALSPVTEFLCAE